MTDANHSDPLNNGALEVTYSKSDKMFTVKVIAEDYSYEDLTTDNPWAEYTGDSDQTLRVCVSWHDTIHTKGVCIKSTGNVRIRRSFHEFDSYRTHHLVLTSDEAECVNCAGNFSTKDLLRFNFYSPNATAVVMNGKFTFGPHNESQIAGKTYAFQGITSFENEEQVLKGLSRISQNWKSYLRNDELYSVEVSSNNTLVRKDEATGESRTVAFATIDHRSQDRLKEPDQDQIYNLWIAGRRVTKYNAHNVLYPEKKKEESAPIYVNVSQIDKFKIVSTVLAVRHEYHVMLTNCHFGPNGKEASILCDEKYCGLGITVSGKVQIDCGEEAGIKTHSYLEIRSASASLADSLFINTGDQTFADCIYAIDDGDMYAHPGVNFTTPIYCEFTKTGTADEFAIGYTGYIFGGKADYRLNRGMTLYAPYTHYASPSSDIILDHEWTLDKLNAYGVYGTAADKVEWNSYWHHWLSNQANNYKYEKVYIGTDFNTYDEICIDGKYVTSSNCNDILGDGKWSFDPASYVLHVADNTTLNSTKNAAISIINKNKPVTIDFGKNCCVRGVVSAIDVYDSNELTLTGQSAKLVGNEGHGVMGTDARLVIAMDSLYAEGYYWGINSDVKVVSSSVRALGNSGAIAGSVETDDAYVVENSAVKVVKGFITDGKGGYAKDVSIVKGPQPWNLRINGDRITPANAKDVLGDGSIQFYPGHGPNGEDLLELRSADIKTLSVPASSEGAKAVNNLHILLYGDCKITNNIIFYGSQLSLVTVKRTDDARGEYVGSLSTSYIAMNGTHGTLLIEAPCTVTKSAQKAGIKVPGLLGIYAPLTVDGMTTAINAESIAVSSQLFVANQYTFNAAQAGFTDAAGTLQKKVEIMELSTINGLSVNGWSLTPTSYTDILGDGTMWFEPNTATLHLKNVNVTKKGTKVPFIYSETGNYTIVYEGNNTITSSAPAIEFLRGTMNIVSDETTTGYNRLVCTTTDSTALGAIRFGERLNISCIGHRYWDEVTDTVIAVGASAGIYASAAGIITIGNKMALQVKGKTESGLSNVMAINKPENVNIYPSEVVHSMSGGNLLDKTTYEPYTGEVRIQSKFQAWDIYIAGKQVTELNVSELPQKGITFNGTDRLSLESVYINGGDYDGIRLGGSRKYRLILDGSSCIISRTGNAIYAENDLSIAGGHLTLSSDSAVALLANRDLMFSSTEVYVGNGGIQGILSDTVGTPQLKPSTFSMVYSTLISCGGHFPSLAGFNYLDIRGTEYINNPVSAAYVCDLQAEEPFAGVCVNGEITNQTVWIGFPTGIEEITDTNVTINGTCRKIIRNGQLYIIRGGEEYNLQGMKCTLPTRQ